MRTREKLGITKDLLGLRKRVGNLRITHHFINTSNYHFIPAWTIEAQGFAVAEACHWRQQALVQVAPMSRGTQPAAATVLLRDG